jgi:hypothetical protein
LSIWGHGPGDMGWSVPARTSQGPVTGANKLQLFTSGSNYITTVRADDANEIPVP